ncbi:hypothetical protein HDU96_010545 [Phlyctochytrium bullatum]|nr:hypothetical protein HDU96_010545 [Phlyctochytrium bullatum]
MSLNAHKAALKAAAEKHQLEVLTSKDKEECIDLLISSFSDPGDPLALWLSHVPGATEEENKSRLKTIFGYMVRLTNSPIFDNGVVLGSRNAQGKLVGVMFCRVPGNPSTTTWDLLWGLWSFGLPPPYVNSWGECAARFKCLDTLVSTSKQVTTGFNKNYFYVQAFGILPEGRGKGLARRFMKALFEVADAQRVPVYLETESEENEALYKHFGFETLKKLDIASASCTQKMDMWFMARMPNK